MRVTYLESPTTPPDPLDKGRNGRGGVTDYPTLADGQFGEAPVDSVCCLASAGEVARFSWQLIPLLQQCNRTKGCQSGSEAEGVNGALRFSMGAGLFRGTSASSPLVDGWR